MLNIEINDPCRMKRGFNASAKIIEPCQPAQMAHNYMTSLSMMHQRDAVRPLSNMSM